MALHTWETHRLVELEPGIVRVTLALPTGPRHVHCYFLRGDDGWTLVDTGLGLMETPWDDLLAQLDGDVVRIFITHMHPDHVGGAEAAAAATGAPVFQGRLDYAQCERVWGSDDWPERIAEWFIRNGVPPAVSDELIESGHVFADFVRFAWNPTLVEPGDEIDGWRVVATPGHADGHLSLASRRRPDRGRHAADADHAGDRPLPGEPPRSARRLRRHARRASPSSRRASRTAGTAFPWRARPSGAPRRSRTTRTGSTARRRRSAPSRARASRSRTTSSGTSCRAIQRRFAVAETLSHLERLVVARPRGAARRTTAASPILRASPVDDLPSSTYAPRLGA